MTKRCLFIIAITVILIGSNTGHALASMSIENTADAIRATVALIDHGKMQFFYDGKMHLEGQPVTEDTIFETSSSASRDSIC